MLNVPAIPMEWMPPHGYGFIRIANDNGDALAFDAGTAELFRFDHDISYFQDKIVVIEGPNLRKEFPMNCEGLRSASTHRYASFSDFCRKILEAATIARTNTAPPPPVQ